ncbi:MAG TPA: radical SAM protein [Firmicutes bacterium]|nr:radical SAM protein [Bacillota bacterium]
MDKIQRLAIEYNLTEHCNLRCANCDHSANMLPKKFATIEQFKKDLEALSEVLHVQELKLLGGEPLLHEQVVEFVKLAREIKIADRIVLLTNGTLLKKAPKELWKLLDGIWISLYPGIKYSFDDEYLQRLSDEYNLWIWKKETPQFVQVLLNKRNDNPKLVNFIYQMCLDAHTYSCHTVHEGYYYKCAPAAFMKKRLEMLGVEYSDKMDGVPIHNNPNLKRDLMNYIYSKTPIAACSYCLGSLGKFHECKQLKPKEILKALQESHDNVEELLNTSYILPSSITNPSM